MLHFTMHFERFWRSTKKNKVNSIFKKAIDLLVEYKIVYPLEKGQCTLFFVHPKNRAGLGLSWHNVHRNGKTIHNVGADLKELKNAFAMEMATDEQTKAKQLDFNLSLISRSNNLLAEPTGFELYLTLGCGHTVGFCRAVVGNCKTSEKEIATDDGHIDAQLIRSDAVFASMLDDGWDWTINPAWIDKEFPEFADIAQKSLSASNHVASLVGEIEVAKSIADVMMDGQTEGWDTRALAVVKTMGAQSSNYAKTILTFVSEFTGGTGAPMVKFLDSVAKSFQCNAVLGERHIGSQ